MTVARLRTAVSIVFFVAILIVAGCSSSRAESTAVPATPTPTPVPIDPQEVLGLSGQAMQALDTFHFRLEHDKGSSEMLPGLKVEDVNGVVANPNRISVSFTGAFGGSFAVRSKLVTVGDRSYMTNPLNDRWEEVPPDVSPLGFFDPSKGIGAMMEQVVQADLIDQDDGQLRLAGRLPAEALGPLLGSAIEGAVVDIELTIDSETMYLLMARVTGRVMPSDEEGTERVISLSAFDEPVTIEPPI